MQCWMYYRMEKPWRGNLNHCCIDCDTHFEVYNYGKLKNAHDIKVKLSSDIKDTNYVGQTRGTAARQCYFVPSGKSIREFKCMCWNEMQTFGNTSFMPIESDWSHDWGFSETLILIKSNSRNFFFYFWPRKLETKKLLCQLSFFICPLSGIFSQK